MASPIQPPRGGAPPPALLFEHSPPCADVTGLSADQSAAKGGVSPLSRSEALQPPSIGGEPPLHPPAALPAVGHFCASRKNPPADRVRPSSRTHGGAALRARAFSFAPQKALGTSVAGLLPPWGGFTPRRWGLPPHPPEEGESESPLLHRWGAPPTPPLTARPRPAARAWTS